MAQREPRKTSASGPAPAGRLTGLFLSLAVCLSPAVALACPYCARDTPPAMSALIGAILLLPFGIAWLVIRSFRRVSDGEAALPPPAPASTELTP